MSEDYDKDYVKVCLEVIAFERKEILDIWSMDRVWIVKARDSK